jgi:enamine deaminase RidA (YjgF/YER057c/UK114 family)
LENTKFATPQPSPYVTPLTVHNGLGFLSGQLPRKNGEIQYRGKVGAQVDVDSARAAARLCAEACIAALEKELGSSDRIVRILKITGFVASAPGFNGQPIVIDAASERFIELLGDAGRHARSAVGVAELPHDACVEVELVVAVR